MALAAQNLLLVWPRRHSAQSQWDRVLKVRVVRRRLHHCRLHSSTHALKDVVVRWDVGGVEMAVSALGAHEALSVEEEEGDEEENEGDEQRGHQHEDAGVGVDPRRRVEEEAPVQQGSGAILHFGRAVFPEGPGETKEQAFRSRFDSGSHLSFSMRNLDSPFL